MTPTTQWALTMGLAVAAVGWDLTTHRVPNVVTLGAAGGGVVIALLQSGMEGVVFSVLGWLTGLLLLLPFFALGGLGGGDVKLLAAFGSFLGPVATLWATLWAALAGGALAVVVAVSHGYLRRALWNLWIMVGWWRVSGLRAVPGMTLRDSGGPRLAYAVPIAIGALSSLWIGTR